MRFNNAFRMLGYVEKFYYVLCVTNIVFYHLSFNVTLDMAFMDVRTDRSVDDTMDDNDINVRGAFLGISKIRKKPKKPKATVPPRNQPSEYFFQYFAEKQKKRESMRSFF